MAAQLTIFAIYTSEDKEILLHLLRHLKPLEKELEISIWHDDAIEPGQLWKPQIESRLNEADIFLLLVSNTFMYSEFIKQLEFKMVIDQYKAGRSTVIPILLDDCQWDIEFKSDEYDFSLKELQVLPEGAKPIKTWDSENQAIERIAAGIKKEIRLLRGDSTQQEAEKEIEQQPSAQTEEQIALSFTEAKETEAAIRSKEEAEAQRKSDVENRLQEEAEANAKLAQENKIREETEAKQIAEEEQRRKAADAKNKLEEEKRLQKAAETQRKIAEAKRLQEETETKRRAEEQEVTKQKVAKKQNTQNVKDIEHGAEEAKESDYKKIALRGALVALLAIAVVWAFSKFTVGSEEEPARTPDANTVVNEDSIVSDPIEAEAIEAEEVLATLVVGDIYDGGFVFEIDKAGKTGKIAHVDDVGPMTWINAMNIQEQLGEGWRLPTFEELLLMQKSIGPGGTNRGEFTNGLYWSATDFDDYQARLLRFRDANRSYHYNKEAEHRQFRVRAIREFNR